MNTSSCTPIVTILGRVLLWGKCLNSDFNELWTTTLICNVWCTIQNSGSESVKQLRLGGTWNKWGEEHPLPFELCRTSDLEPTVFPSYMYIVVVYKVSKMDPKPSFKINTENFENNKDFGLNGF